MFDGIWVLILAAGASRRMGSPKMLLPAPEGNLLAQTASRALAACPLQVAVIADKQGPVRREALHGLPVEWLETDRASFGLGASLAAGVELLAARYAPRGIMVLLGDQPLIDPKLIRLAAERYLEGGTGIVQVRYTDRPAHPVLFDTAFFAELQQLSGDEGAKGLLRRYQRQISYVDAAGPAPDDIDTPEEYQKYMQKVIGGGEPEPEKPENSENAGSWKV